MRAVAPLTAAEYDRLAIAAIRRKMPIAALLRELISSLPEPSPETP